MRFSGSRQVILGIGAAMLAPAGIMLMGSQTPATAAPAASTRPNDAALTQVANYIRAVKSLTANFAQTDNKGQTLTGQLTLKQPGKIRFQYQKGIPLLIVGDGSALTMIDYEVRQVQRWPIKNSPLGALIDPSRDFTKFGKVIPTGDPNVLSIEAKDPKRPEYGTITLVFQRKASAPAGLDLYGWVAKDAQGNLTSFRLTGHQYNAPVADSVFRWQDPRTRARPGGG